MGEPNLVPKWPSNLASDTNFSLSSYDRRILAIKFKAVHNCGTHVLPKEKLISTNGPKIKSQSLPFPSLEKKIKLDHNLKLSRIGNKYFIYFVDFMTPETTNIKTDKLVSIDPGVDMFVTYYSPHGECGEIGEDIPYKINKLRKKEKFIKEKFKERRQKVESISSKINNKIVNLIDDFHWKTVHFLIRNFDKILIPRLYVSKCHKKVKDMQREIRHCQFVDRLIYKSSFYAPKEVHEVKEHWTSKTCTNCGNIKRNLGRNKIYKCDKCKIIIGRDLNASRNILLKHLSSIG